MTKKDYEVLAQALNAVRRILPKNDQYGTGGTVWRNCVDIIADACERDNPRFDRARFWKAARGDA